MHIPICILLLFSVSTVRSAAFNYGTDKIRGVNLGAWLILESWLTPSIFTNLNDSSVVDEYTYGRKFGRNAAGKRLKPHWDKFITEADFQQIKAAGLNHVRLPVGYWSIVGNSTEYYPVGAYPYVQKAADWAKKYGLKLIIDIHGAPGSQNGFDNSGRKGPIAWHTSAVNVQRTRDALAVVIKDFVANPAYSDTVSVQPLNEPGAFVGGAVGDAILSATKQFYYDTYGQTRYAYGNATKTSTLFSIHDAFQNGSYWKDFMPYPGWENVALDTHYYSLFSDVFAKYTIAQHIKEACKKKQAMLDSNQYLWTYVGEFGLPMTDCAGSTTVVPVANGAWFDGTAPYSTKSGRSCKGKTGAASTFSADTKRALRQHFEAQMNSFEAGAGWIAWTWKTQTGKTEEWSYQKGLEYGWIPKNLSERQFADPCDTTGLNRLP